MGLLNSCMLGEESDEEVAPPPSYMAGMDRRRKSVFAESYEPGEGDEAVERVSWCQSFSNFKELIFFLSPAGGSS